MKKYLSPFTVVVFLLTLAIGLVAYATGGTPPSDAPVVEAISLMDQIMTVLVLPILASIATLVVRVLPLAIQWFKSKTAIENHKHANAIKNRVVDIAATLVLEAAQTTVKSLKKERDIDVDGVGYKERLKKVGEDVAKKALEHADMEGVLKDLQYVVFGGDLNKAEEFVKASVEAQIPNANAMVGKAATLIASAANPQ